MKNCFFALAVLGLFIVSCNRSSFKTTGSGLEYRFVHHCLDSQKVAVGDYLVMDVKYFTPSDSLLFTSWSLPGKFRMKAKQPGEGGGASIDDALLMMHVGDSASFLIDAQQFMTVTLKDSCPSYLSGKKIRFEIKIIDIQTEEEIQVQKRELVARKMAREQELIDDFIANAFPDAKPDSSGLYLVEVKKGKGRVPMEGDKVVIQYVARFLNGEQLTNTRRWKEPFSFEMGKRQVIEGLEKAVAASCVGSTFVCIIPSKLAYGEEGHSKVPSCTPLYFEVEIVGVK